MNSRQFPWKTVFPLLLLLTAVGAAGAIVAFKPQTVEQASESTIPKVDIIRVEPQTLKLNVFSQGVVTPREEIDLISEVAGKVVQVHPGMVAGGFFTAHEVLLTIDTHDYDYAIAAAEARLAEARRVLINERAQVAQAESEWRALGEGEPSELALRKPQLAEAEAKLQAAKADLAKAKLNRGRCELRAPFAGRVLSKRVGLGQYIQAGSVAARIYASDIAEVRLPIGTDQLAFVNLPLGRQQSKAENWPKVILRAELAGRLRGWEGRIVRSEAALDGNSGQLYLVAQVADRFAAQPDQLPLLSGLFVQAEIEGVSRENMIALPRGAVNNLQQVKLVDADRRLEIRQLELLRTESDRVVVKSGLAAGDKVVVSEMPMPVAGMSVNIAEPNISQTQ